MVAKQSSACSDSANAFLLFFFFLAIMMISVLRRGTTISKQGFHFITFSIFSSNFFRFFFFQQQPAEFVKMFSPAPSQAQQPLQQHEQQTPSLYPPRCPSMSFEEASIITTAPPNRRSSYFRVFFFLTRKKLIFSHA